MLCKTYNATLFGLKATIVCVEVLVEMGIRFALVGMADHAIRESQQRIDSALKSISEKIPRKAVTINLSPADIKKKGAHFDLSIAAGLLAANKKLKPDKLNEYLIIGELSLDGKVLPVKGIIPICLEAKKQGFKGIVLPKENAQEASLVDNFQIISVQHISDLMDFFNADGLTHTQAYIPPDLSINKQELGLDFNQVIGQQFAMQGALIAACGKHNLMFIGAPGVGKSMIAKRIQTILPALTEKEFLEAAAIHSAAGKTLDLSTRTPIIYAPHHMASSVSILGGGKSPKPGAISLAHNGVLFLDEMLEFNRDCLEALREPLEEKSITISRANYTEKLQANFMLLASMNPCPCGYLNHPTKNCSCNTFQLKRYFSKLSGPLLDRIDLHIHLKEVKLDKLVNQKSSSNKTYSSKILKEKVVQVRAIQANRMQSTKTNAELNIEEIKRFCVLEKHAKQTLIEQASKKDFSLRSYHKILKIARTIADIDDQKIIETPHVLKALSFRALDRNEFV